MNHQDDNDDPIHAIGTNHIILALDIGSSSVRCTSYDYSRKSNGSIDTVPVVGCSSAVKRRSVEPITGAIETNGLLEAVDFTIDEVLSKLRAKFEDDDKQFVVQAVGFSTFTMNLIAVDGKGQLIPLKESDGIGEEMNTTAVGMSYACNTANVHAECQRLRQELGPDELDKLYQATGAPLHSAYALPQLRVLYQENRSLLEKHEVHRWQSIASYCVSRWTNRTHLPISYSEASWTGLLNIRDCVFEKSAIRWLPPECRAALPQLADFNDYISGIPQFLHKNETGINPYWTKFPELRATKFFLGLGDGACANVGSKCTTSSRIAVTVGTSAAARVCVRHSASLSPRTSSRIPDSSGLFIARSNDLPFRIPDCRGLFCYRIDKDHLLVGGALTDGGSIVEWALRFLNLEKDQEAFQKCLYETEKLVQAEYEQAQTNHRDGDLIMVPFLSGERSTGFRDGATGAVFGLTLETTPAHFFKSCLEGVSLRLRAITELLLVVIDRRRIEDRDNIEVENTTDSNNADTQSPVLVASGKALEVNHLWRQLIADSSGLRVVLDKDTAEGTSRGVARLVAMSLVEEREATDRETSVNTSCEHIAEEMHKKISLQFEQDEEVLHPFLTSEPRSIANILYSKKSNLQENFIDSITPFFSPS